MASLTLTQTGLRNEVSYQLGYGRTYSSASASQQADVDASVQSGLRAFYWPETGYDWTFLQNRGTLTTVAGTRTYDLAADFSSAVGDFTWPDTTGDYCPIRVISEFKLRELLQGVALANQRPQYVAIIQKTPFTGTLFQAQFDQPFDSVYTITYEYRVVPNSDSTLYGVGAHSDTILAACLAAAEQRIDSTQQSYRADFKTRLAASMSIDQALRPNHYGSYYDKTGPRRDERHQSVGIPTFYRNGVQV